MIAAQSPSRVFLLSHLIGCSVLWASGFLFIKLVPDLHFLVIASLRGILGAASLMLWFAVQGRRIGPAGREWRDWAVLGTLNGWGPNILVAFALTQITAASASMIQASSPIIVAMIAHIVLPEEQLTMRRLFGILVGFTGIAILIGPAALPESGVSAAGALAMLATATSYAVGNVYAKTVKDADPARLAMGQQAGSAIPATMIALAVTGPAGFAPATESAVPLLALGILATALPILLFMRLIRGAGPTRAAMVGYLLPVWATLLALAFLGESVGLREVLACAVILTGVAIVSFTSRRGM
jgi:drug/metabolite transporter (DMT)-like permease